MIVSERMIYVAAEILAEKDRANDTPGTKARRVLEELARQDLIGEPAVKQAKADPGMNVAGYETLREVLHLAYDQSARGKGKERHANAKPFHLQPIMELGKMSGLGGHVYQMMKKAQEAGNMAARGKHDAARAEFLGVIVYAAAAHLLTGIMQGETDGED